MIDALLFAVRDSLRAAGLGYGQPQVEIMDDGKPPAGAGNIFVSIHEGSSKNSARRNLDERFGFSLTLTMRVSVPPDRIGSQLLASKLARTSGGPGQPSFNSRVEQLRAWGHMNWGITVSPGQTPNSANDNLVAWAPPGTVSIFGFVEPAGFVGAEQPRMVYGDWFTANPEAKDVGIKSELRFENARRMQPQTLSVGPYI